MKLESTGEYLIVQGTESIASDAPFRMMESILDTHEGLLFHPQRMISGQGRQRSVYRPGYGP